jgi:transposase
LEVWSRREEVEELTPSQNAVAWVGIDIGKTHHWACALDDQGAVLLSRKVANDHADLTALQEEVAALTEEAVWAVDIIASPAALLLALLTGNDRPVHYAPGRLVSAMSSAYRGEGKTDAKDAYVIAETLRHRRDLPVVRAESDLVRELELLSGRRRDLSMDRVRMLNRLRDLMTSVFPSLEREFDLKSCKGALVLLTGYATPERIRRCGQARLARWLRARHVRDSSSVATRALTAAEAQPITLPGQDLAAEVIADMARDILTLDERVKALDARIAATFAHHPQAEIIVSMPGFGAVLGAALLVAAGDLGAFPTAGHLAAAAGLVPVPNDSGRRTGNLHRPRRFNRPLRRALYLAAQTAMIRPGPNRDYYLKKRAQGRTHTEAVIALARRRVDVLWALLRENRAWQETAPAPVVQAA